jgi:hypothetical protein
MRIKKWTLIFCPVAMLSGIGLKATGAGQAAFHVKSEKFIAMIGNQELFVEHFKAIHYVDFTFEKKAELKVTFSDPI